jgi:hypothetical protein
MPRISACKFGRTFVHLNSRTAAQVVVANRFSAFYKNEIETVILNSSIDAVKLGYHLP